MQKANVDVIRTAIKRVSKIGIETIDGQVHEADIIVCATGFSTSFSSRYDISGRHGCSLRSLWQDRGPEAYLGLAIAGLPNYFSENPIFSRFIRSETKNMDQLFSAPTVR